MRRKRLLNKIWNALSFFMGTAYSWIILVVTIFLIYYFMRQGFNQGFAYAEASLVSPDIVEVMFMVRDGDTLEMVSENLQDEGIIGSAFLFRLENMIRGSDTNFIPGEYALNSEMTTETINSILRRDPVNTEVTITILEGYSIRNIATYLDSLGILPEETFIWASYNHVYRSPILEGREISRYWLEGYLFPDTYRIRGDLNPQETADHIINRMLARFEEKWVNLYAQRAAEKNLDMHTVITIASIIEKDFPIAEERYYAAQVIFNRLERGMNLEMPSTLMFALEERVRLDRLTPEHMGIDSPYNTFNRSGLPPTPICNPGDAAIQAVLNHTGGNKLYAVRISESTFEHIFTHSEEEYLALLETYNKIYN